MSWYTDPAGGARPHHWGSLVSGAVRTSCGKTLSPPVMPATQDPPPADVVCAGCRSAIAIAIPDVRCWYVRPGVEPTTHWGGVLGARVYTSCGLSFARTAEGVVALPGEPPDPTQVCPHCGDARQAARDQVGDSPG